VEAVDRAERGSKAGWERHRPQVATDVEAGAPTRKSMVLGFEA
jgi:hypothetical protein